VCREFGIENEIIPKIATGFGGGIGNTGSVCGAVIGATMAIGLIRERAETTEDYLELAKLVQQLRSRFEAEMKTLYCRDLTGADLTTEEGREQLMNSDIAMKSCFPAVGLAYQLTMDLLKANR